MPKTPVELVEYGDYECPNCLEAFPIVKKLRKKFGTKMSFKFKNFPITESHPHALHAAHAAESAKLQGKLEEMHDLIFEHQDALEDSDLLTYAKKLNLGEKKFIKDFESKKVADIVKKDFLEGARKGVNGTPTFFINGTRHDDEYDYKTLESAIKSRF